MGIEHTERNFVPKSAAAAAAAVAAAAAATAAARANVSHKIMSVTKRRGINFDIRFSLLEFEFRTSFLDLRYAMEGEFLLQAMIGLHLRRNCLLLRKRLSDSSSSGSLWTSDYWGSRSNGLMLQV